MKTQTAEQYHYVFKIYLFSVKSKTADVHSTVQ